jgi:hypothetical protein
VVVSFNTCDYSFGPNEEITIQPLNFTESENVITRQMVQGREYSIGGIVDSNWFIDNDFFELNEEGNYVFLAVDGTYTLTAYNNYKFLQVYSGTASEPATLQSDGSGALWVIGGNGINKPLLTSANNKSWWTDPDWDQCLAPIAKGVYRITLTVGKQLAATDINFKFFGQPTWGIEFNGQGGDYHLDSDNDWFRVNAASSDNGNIFLKDGAVLNDGDTFVLTVDLTAGVANGVLTVDKK